ncbi:MAG: leucine-rich repeat protein [Prevotella sp.]|nr:leucine-rich repeat protein [Candidatus Prevotella equi]
MDDSYFILTANNTLSPTNHEIGEGSTCIVSIEWHDGRRVFAKRLKPEYCGIKLYEDAFRKEYEIGNRLNSPQLSQYICMGDDGCIYEEYIDGKTLERLLNDDPEYFLNERNLRRFFKELLLGLNYLHSRQILHLDLKPQNIMLTRLGNSVKIIDLGFAYSDSYISSIGATKEFAAPELLDGTMLPDITMDIYSIGRILHYIANSTKQPLPRLFLTIQERCTQHDPTLRYQSASEILELLNNSSQQENNKKHSQKSSKMMVISSALVLLISVVLAFTFHRSIPNTFRLNNHLVCQLISSDSLTVAITHDTLATYNLKDGEMDITIPSTIEHKGRTFTVTEIDSCTFMDCKPLIAIVFPQTLKSIGNRAFLGCKNLSHINIPDSVTHIGEYAFRECAINSLRLPLSLEVLESGIFSCCNKLREVEVPQNVKELRRDAFGGCLHLERITLPEGLQVIDRGVFWKCRNLKTITIPSTVTRLGDFVFWGCKSLTDVYMLNPEPPRITDIFEGRHLRIHVPQTAVSAYKSAQYWKDHEIVPIEQ